MVYIILFYFGGAMNNRNIRSRIHVRVLAPSWYRIRSISESY